MEQQFVDAQIAAAILGVHRRTLFRWAKDKKIAFIRPGGVKGKWLFDVASLGIKAGHHAKKINAVGFVDAIYARVSTRKQLDSLKTQIQTLKVKYPDHTVFSDCASGLNFKRKGLLSLLQLAFEGRLRFVRIAHRDRLCRFAYDLIEHILRAHGSSITVEAQDSPPSSERELAEDVLAVITVFGARLYGSRSGRRRAQVQEVQGPV